MGDSHMDSVTAWCPCHGDSPENDGNAKTTRRGSGCDVGGAAPPYRGPGSRVSEPGRPARPDKLTFSFRDLADGERHSADYLDIHPLG